LEKKFVANDRLVLSLDSADNPSLNASE